MRGVTSGATARMVLKTCSKSPKDLTAFELKAIKASPALASPRFNEPNPRPAVLALELISLKGFLASLAFLETPSKPFSALPLFLASPSKASSALST